MRARKFGIPKFGIFYENWNFGSRLWLVAIQLKLFTWDVDRRSRREKLEIYVPLIIKINSKVFDGRKSFDSRICQRDVSCWIFQSLAFIRLMSFNNKSDISPKIDVLSFWKFKKTKNNLLNDNPSKNFPFSTISTRRFEFLWLSKIE